MYIQTRYSIIDIQYYFICLPVIALSQEQQEFLVSCFGKILNKHNCYMIDMSTKKDQIHVVFTLPLDQTLKGIINVLKSHSSFLFRKQYPETKEDSCLWFKNYIISTIGEKNEKAVNRIMNKMKKKDHVM